MSLPSHLQRLSVSNVTLTLGGEREREREKKTESPPRTAGVRVRTVGMAWTLPSPPSPVERERERERARERERETVRPSNTRAAPAGACPQAWGKKRERERGFGGGRLMQAESSRSQQHTVPSSPPPTGCRDLSVFVSPTECLLSSPPLASLPEDRSLHSTPPPGRQRTQTCVTCSFTCSCTSSLLLPPPGDPLPAQHTPTQTSHLESEPCIIESEHRVRT